MCNMWSKIKFGVKWIPDIKLLMAIKDLNLSNVKDVHISMDPFFKDNNAIREFLYYLSTQSVRLTNPKSVLTHEIRYDGKPPFFIANLNDKRKIIFKTEGMQPTDVINRFKKLCHSE